MQHDDDEDEFVFEPTEGTIDAEDLYADFLSPHMPHVPHEAMPRVQEERVRINPVPIMLITVILCIGVVVLLIVALCSLAGSLFSGFGI